MKIYMTDALHEAKPALTRKHGELFVILLSRTFSDQSDWARTRSHGERRWQRGGGGVGATTGAAL